MAETIPTILVAFGATGDLMAKKIIPSLYFLYNEDNLPKNFQIIGFTRRDYNDLDFRKYVKEVLYKFDTKIEKKNIDRFLMKFSFISSHFDNEEGYESLAHEVAHLRQGHDHVNLMFYLSVAPEFYSDIVLNIGKVKQKLFGSHKETTVKLLVEKPLGNSGKSAKEIDLNLKKVFREEEIYRIDHYLQKRIVRNIFAFRFFNSVFESIWNNKYIEKIEIVTNEDIGVENRGSFYDQLGTLRDVGQNHLLEIMALLTMDKPRDFSAELIRIEREKALRDLRKFKLSEVVQNTFRGQYEGYTSIENIDKNSKTETYFKVKAFIDSNKWYNVPIYLEAGKKLDKSRKEIIVTFKSFSKDIPENFDVNKLQNKVIFSLNGESGIKLDFTLFSEEENQEFLCFIKEHMGKRQYVSEYMQVLLDCFKNDATWFVTNTEVDLEWQFIDPIVEAWKQNAVPLKTYAQNTNPKSSN